MFITKLPKQHFCSWILFAHVSSKKLLDNILCIFLSLLLLSQLLFFFTKFPSDFSTYISCNIITNLWLSSNLYLLLFLLFNGLTILSFHFAPDQVQILRIFHPQCDVHYHFHFIRIHLWFTHKFTLWFFFFFFI